MKPSHRSNNVLKLTRSSAPSSRYLVIAHELAKSPPKALRIVINCERFEALSGPKKNPFELLSREVELWADLLGQRTLSSLNLIHAHRFLQPFEITHLLHLLSSKFSVRAPDERRFIAVSNLEELTNVHLALIKGLNFDGYQIIVAKQQLKDVDAIERKTKLLRDFAIKRIGIQLLHSDCLTTIRELIKNIEARCQPDYICLGKTWDTFDLVSMHTSEEDEERLYNDTDLLEIGPEATTHIGELHVQNYCSPEKYKASIDVARLPIHTSH